MNDPRIKINLDEPSQDLEGTARDSADLKRGLVTPNVRVHPMPHMSDE